MTEQGEIEYCHSWNARRNEVGVPLSEAEARVRDAEGEPFIAVLRRPDFRPVLVEVSWGTDCVTVTFFDEQMRENLKYWFYKVAGDRMFLSNVVYREYPDDNPRRRLSESSSIEAVTFEENGYMKRILTKTGQNHRDVHEYRDVPVEGNYEPIPAFGDYWSLGRRERP